MIAFLKGIVWDVRGDSLILDVNGVGYKVYVPMAAFDTIPVNGQETMLHTQMQVREDNCTLFGFADGEQQNMFNLLLGVNGIGAKMALAVLNTLTPTDIVFAVQVNNVDAFKSVSGIGKKTAERIVMELKDKCAKTKLTAQPTPTTQVPLNDHSQALTALTQLGYPAVQAAKMLQAALQEVPETASIETIITTALRLAAK